MKSLYLCCVFITLFLSFQPSHALEELNQIDSILEQFTKNIDKLFTEYTQNTPESDSVECRSCQSLIALGVEKATEPYEEKITKIIEEESFKICKKTWMDNDILCGKQAKAMCKIKYENLKKKLLSPYTLCSYLSKCPGYTDLDIEAEQKRILKDKPSQNQLDQYNAKLKEKYEEYNKNKEKKVLNVLHISDIHVDINYEEGAPQTDCGFPTCCHKGQQGEGSAGYWGNIVGGHCDLPMRTLDQIINYMRDNIDFDFALWTGDTQSHISWENTMENTIGITKEVSEKLQKNFPGKIFYSTNGNEEGYPNYQFDFSGQYDQTWKNEFSQFWGKWLSKEAQEQMKELGYFSQYDQKHKVKILSLNTLTCDPKNLFLVPNPTDPGNMLQFMEKELQESEKNNENVYIIGHIASQHCIEDWGKIYTAIIERYAHIIRAQFFGHTHMDALTMYKNVFENTDKPNNIQFLAPSITTSHAINPSFRIYQVDPDTMQVLNYQQYRLNLHKYNTLGSKAKTLEWNLAYTFLEQYGLKSMSVENMGKMALELKNQNSLTYKKYNCNFRTSCSIMSENDLKFLSKEENVVVNHYCSANIATVNELKKCMGQSTEGTTTEKIIQFLSGPWKTKNQGEN